jgi:hypothetical protein
MTRSFIASNFVVLVLSEAVLRETVLVLDGCLNCGDADRSSRRFAGNCGPIGRIDILGHFENEYEYRDAEYEYEYEKNLEQCGALKSPVVLS